MRAEDIRAFAERDWTRVSLAKLEHWKNEYREHGPAAAVRAADALRAHVGIFARRTAVVERRRDLESHARLNRRIDAARPRFRR